MKMCRKRKRIFAGRYRNERDVGLWGGISGVFRLAGRKHLRINKVDATS